MKISYNWLKDYLKIKLTPEKLAEELTVKSFEVEGIEKIGRGLEKIVVGEILDIKPHPKADKLQLVRVDIGGKKSPSFVCGAFNIKKGQKVPIVLAGTTLPDGTQVKKAAIRGIESPGMLCSEKELGLGEDCSGIMILDPELKIGQFLTKVLKLEDTVLDLDVLPNRAHDCLSHIGVAREVAAITDSEFRIQNSELREDKSLKIENFVKVKVQDKKLCPRYTARVVTDVKIKDSPQWLKNRLQACGARPINNIVDITNYVMLEYGQPLHAFDFEKISGVQIRNPKSEIRNKSKIQNSKFKTIIVRKAKEGEEIATLDGEKRKLTKDMLVIADSEKPIAIAGVMGGLASEVKSATKTIILESANFDSLNIRQTSNKLGLRSESSDHFGYGIDPNLASQAQDRAAYLMQELAGGNVASGMIDIYPKKIKPWKIKLDLDWLNKFLGIKIPAKQIIKILTSLGLDTKYQILDTKYQITVPTFRLDLTIPEDIAEEIARIYGYDRIEEKNPMAELKPVPKNEPLCWENYIKDILCGAGFSEVYNYSFVGEDLLCKTGLSVNRHIKLKNPLSRDLSCMRQDLVPRMLEKASQNLRNFESFKIFELGRIYMAQEGKLPCEAKMICGAIVGQKLTNQFYQAKGAVELLLNKLNIKNYSFEPLAPKELTCWPYYHPARAAKIMKDSAQIGTVAEIHPKLTTIFDIKAKVALFGLDFEKLSSKATTKKAFKKIPKYPAVTLDLAFILAKKVLHDDVKNAIFEAGRPLIKQVELFDVYEGKPLERGQKSLAFHITYQAEDRTLKDKEVKAVQDKIVDVLRKRFGAEIREE